MATTSFDPEFYYQKIKIRQYSIDCQNLCPGMRKMCHNITQAKKGCDSYGTASFLDT